MHQTCKQMPTGATTVVDGAAPEGEYEIDCIIKHKKVKGGKLKYYIKWKGYSHKDNTWEFEENISDCRQFEVYRQYSKALELSVIK